MNNHIILYYPVLILFLFASCFILLSHKKGILSVGIIVFNSGIWCIGFGFLVLPQYWINLAIILFVTGFSLFIGGIIILIRRIINLYGFPKFR